MSGSFRAFMVDDYCPKSLEGVQAKNASDLEKGAKQYGILGADGQVLGAVWGEALGDGQFAGHLVFERHALSGGEKLELTRQALRAMFQSGARKICWQALPDNR